VGFFSLVRRWIEEAINKGNLSVMDEIVAHDYVYREPMVGERRGKQAARELVTMYADEFDQAARVCAKVKWEQEPTQYQLESEDTFPVFRLADTPSESSHPLRRTIMAHAWRSPLAQN
jgi:hypothetical protein